MTRMHREVKVDREGLGDDPLVPIIHGLVQSTFLAGQRATQHVLDSRRRNDKYNT